MLSLLSLMSMGAPSVYRPTLDPRLAPLAAPATPLVANDPYFQTYSPRGGLTDNPTVAGTNGREQQMSAAAFIEGHVCQLIGPPSSNLALPAKQLSVTVYPTRTVYEMLCGESWNLKTPITITFMTPQIPANLTLMARPASYVTFFSPPNAGSGNIPIYFDVSYQAAATEDKEGAPTQIACSTNTTAMGLGYAWLGNAATQDTPIPCADPLNCREGDNINWGQLYLGNDGDTVVVGPASDLRAKFLSQGKLGESEKCDTPISADHMPVMATTLDLNNQNDPGEPLSVVLAYNDDVAIRWWGTDFPGLWTQESPTFLGMLENAMYETDHVMAVCKAFDNAEVDKYNKVGGPKFATILSLAYRQAYSSTKLTWNTENNIHWQFLKEISTGSDLSVSRRVCVTL